jgi:hypothetical protein
MLHSGAYLAPRTLLGSWHEQIRLRPFQEALEASGAIRDAISEKAISEKAISEKKERLPCHSII